MLELFYKVVCTSGLWSLIECFRVSTSRPSIDRRLRSLNQYSIMLNEPLFWPNSTFKYSSDILHLLSPNDLLMPLLISNELGQRIFII